MKLAFSRGSGYNVSRAFKSVRRIVNFQPRSIVVKKYFKTTIVVTVILTLVIVSGAKWFLNRKLKGAEKATTVRIEVVQPSELGLMVMQHNLNAAREMIEQARHYNHAGCRLFVLNL
jgi:hypothetical protein